MRKSSSRLLATLALLAAVAGGAYWYWSPYLDMKRMAAAARQGDADRFNDHVDYPRLRESLKGQFAAGMAEAMGGAGKDNPMAGLGAMIGLGLVNTMVDAMVRPEVMMKAMTEGKLAPQKAASQPSRDGSAPPERAEPSWAFERRGLDKIISYMVDPEKPTASNSERLGFVFERAGFATWKLTEIRLPKTT